MAVVSCFLSVTSTPTPTSQDSPNTSSPPSPPSITRPPAKITLPDNKQLKWSTRVAPGDNGGPPTTSKLSRYRGGDEDPLASDDYLWNKDFTGRMKRLIQDPDHDADDITSCPLFASAKEEPFGFLSLNRVISLDNLEVDLSEELMAASGSVVIQQVEEQTDGTVAKKWRAAPTRRELEKWDRSTKAATGGSDVMLWESRHPREDPEVLAAQSREQYFKSKEKLQLLTLGIGSVGVVSAYFSYSP